MWFGFYFWLRLWSCRRFKCCKSCLKVCNPLNKSEEFTYLNPDFEGRTFCHKLSIFCLSLC